MLRQTKTTQFDGTSYVTGEDGAEQTIAYFSATIRADDTASISMSISNSALYEAHKATVRADYADFQATVYAAQDA